MVAEHWHNLPFRNELLKLSPQYLSLLVLAAFLISMLWKAYCIGIVWRCYKYLTLRQQSRNNTIQFILPGEGSERITEPDYSTLLHEREAGFGSALKQTPPPSYQDIMDDQPPPYPTILVNEVHNIHSSSAFVEIPIVNPELVQQDEAAAVVVPPAGNGDIRNEEIRNEEILNEETKTDK